MFSLIQKYARINMWSYEVTVHTRYLMLTIIFYTIDKTFHIEIYSNILSKHLKMYMQIETVLHRRRRLIDCLIFNTQE